MIEQFAESVLINQRLKLANCFSDWSILLDFMVKILSTNHIAIATKLLKQENIQS